MRNSSLILLSFYLVSCNNIDSRFEKKLSDHTGISFQNTLSYTEDFNPYTYRNFFNGGGVALGDINNDGLIDIYFTGNIVYDYSTGNIASANGGDIFIDSGTLTTAGSTNCESSIVRTVSFLLSPDQRRISMENTRSGDA